MQQSTGQALAKKHTNTMYNGITSQSNMGNQQALIMGGPTHNAPKIVYQNSAATQGGN